MDISLTIGVLKRLWLSTDFQLFMEEVKVIRDRHLNIILGSQQSDIDYAYHRGAHNTLDEVIKLIESYEE